MELPLNFVLLDIIEGSSVGNIQVVVHQELLVLLSLYIVGVNSHSKLLVSRDKTIS